MGSVSGSNTVTGVKVSSTWGTAVAVGAGNRLPAEISFSDNVTEIVSREIGTGNAMASIFTRGQIQPSVSLTMDVGFDNNFDVLLAQMMGTASISAMITVGQNDYRQTVTYNTTLNAKYLTMAFTATDAGTIEFPSVAINSATIRTSSIPGILEASFEGVASDIEHSSAVNTYAVVTASTARTGNENVTAAFDDKFWINNTSAGALAGGNQLNITSYELSLTRPQTTVNEIKNSLGNSAPINDGLFEGTLTIGLKELPDLTQFGDWDLETTKKCRLTLTGSQIGTGSFRSLDIYIPQMQLVSAPQYSVSSPGINPVTLTFKISKASANPTGMTSTYPYFEIVNTRSTALLA